MAGKRIGYIRVSTVDQNTDRQLEGVTLDRVFTEKASGKDANRAQLQAALDYLRDGDELIVHSMDRLARNVDDLRRLVRELTQRGVTVRFEKESLSFTTEANPMSRLMLTMLGAFAEFERSMIKERQREGIALAKARGVYKGRSKELTPVQAALARQKVSEGVPKAVVAREYGIARQTLYRYL